MPLPILHVGNIRLNQGVKSIDIRFLSFLVPGYPLHPLLVILFHRGRWWKSVLVVLCSESSG